MFPGPPLYLRRKILKISRLKLNPAQVQISILPIDVVDENVVVEDCPKDDNVVGKIVVEFTECGVL